MCPSRKPDRLPTSFYEKGNELLRQAQELPDPERRRIALEAAERYYKADVPRNEPFVTTLLALVVTYAIVIGAAIWAFHSLSAYAAAGVVIGSYCLMALVVGGALRASGYITEKSFFGIVMQGFKTIMLLRKSSSDKN
jgi:hypothetical protein